MLTWTLAAFLYALFLRALLRLFRFTDDTDE